MEAKKRTNPQNVHWNELYKQIKAAADWTSKFDTIISIMNRPVQNIAAEIGFSIYGVDRVLKMKHAPSYAMLIDMVRFIHISPEWLFSVENTGEKERIFWSYAKIRGTRHEIAQRLKEIRKEKMSMTQKMFSACTNLTFVTISEAENEKVDLREESLRKISESCDVGFYWLLAGDEISKEYPTTKKMLDFLWNNPFIRKNIWELMHRGSSPEALSSVQPPSPKEVVDRTLDAQAIGDRIHLLRESHDLSLRAFAAKADVSKSAISVWEKGRSIPDEFIFRRIGEAFSVGVDWIKYGDESRKFYPCDHLMIEFLNEHPEVRKDIWARM